MKNFFVMALVVVGLCGCGRGPVERGEEQRDSERAVDVRVRAVDAPRLRGDGARAGQGALSGTGRDVASRKRAEVTSGPMVTVTGRVTAANGLDGLQVELRRGEEVRDAVDVAKDGRYEVTGPDGSGLSVAVVGVSRAIADLPKPPDEDTTATRTRRLTQDFVIPAVSTVKGRVVDGAEKPVPGALVSLRSEDLITDGWFYGNQQTTSSANGEFVLEGVAAGNADLGAAAEGVGAVTTRIAVPTTETIVLRLTTGSATLQGHVLVFPDDAPMAGAQVEARARGAARTLGLARTAKVLTAANGSFRLDGLPSGEVGLTVRDAAGAELYPAPGEPSNAMIAKLADGESSATTLRVFGGYRLSGLVFDKDTSEPLAGARLRLSSGSSKVTSSGVDGRYEFTGLPPMGSAQLQASLAGFTLVGEWGYYSPDGQGILNVALPTDSAAAERDVPMVAVVTVSGRVENQQGEGIAGSELKWNSSGTEQPTVKSGVDGEFEFHVSPYQDGMIVTTAKGYAYQRMEKPVRVASDDVSGVKIVLKAEAVVEGRVVNMKGEGVAGARIKVADNYMSSNSFTGSTMFSMNSERLVATSGANGEFRAEGLNEGKETLRAEAKGYGKGSEIVELVSGETKSGLEIRLPDELTIEGRVVDQDDKPLKAQISLSNHSPVDTDKEGRFKLGGLSEGKHSFFVIAFNPQRMKSVEAEAGTKDLLVRFEREAVIHCKVVEGGTGRPITEFEVIGAGEVLRDGEGPNGFRIEMEPNHSTYATIKSAGYVTKRFSIEAPDTVTEKEVMLEMGIGGGVRGRVVLAGDKKPVAGVNVIASVAASPAGFGFSDKPDGNTYTDEGGNFLISNLAAGKAKVTAIPKAPLFSNSVQGDVRDGEVTDIGMIEVAGAGRIVVKVEDASGGPKAGYPVSLSSPRGTPMPLMQSDAAGQIIFHDLEPGSYMLAGGMPAEARTMNVELKPGVDANVTIRLGSITWNGTVTVGGAPMADGLIKLESKSGGAGASASVKGGAFGFSGLTPGTYKVSLMKGEAMEAGSMGGFSVSYKEVLAEDVVVPEGAGSFGKSFALP